MRRIRLAWIPAVLLFSGAALGQADIENIFPHKDMVFPQIAAGGGFESWLTVTNSGSTVYNGDLEFYKDVAEQWNPLVNDAPISDGTLSISVSSGATKTYKITSQGTTEVGYAIVTASDINPTSFLEGHLTYYLSSDSLVADSIGVPPAQQFLVSSLPFEDFNSICLALVNTDAAGRPANLELKVYSDTDVQAGVTKELPLANGEYSSQYLYQLFPGVTLGRGHLEIASDVPISGMAITQAPGNQFSSLPLNSKAVTYLVSWVSGHHNFMNHMALWNDGFYVNGYVELMIFDDYDLYAVSGQINEGELHLHFNSYTYGGWFGYIKSNGPFSLGQQMFVFDYYGAAATNSGSGTIEHGTFQATLVP